MSLIKKQKMTERNLAAKRANGRKGRGAVTPAGKLNSAAARLLHGFYSQSRDEVMIALGEDPREYVRLLQSLVDDLRPGAGLQSELVLRMGRTLWRMRRAERMQDSLAVKRVRSGMQKEELLVAPRLIKMHEIYERLVALGRALNRPDFFPTEAEIEALENGFGETPPAQIQKLFPLLRSFAEAAAKAPRPAKENSGAEPLPLSPEAQERESARKELQAMLDGVAVHYLMARDQLMQESDKVRSVENIAALMAPEDEHARPMQRMEDSSLRQLWRLTRMFMMIRRSSSEAEDDENST